MSTTLEEWEQDLGRAADMREDKDSTEQYVQTVMAELARLRGKDQAESTVQRLQERFETEETATAMATPLQTSQGVTYYPSGPNQPNIPWTTPPVQIKPQRTRSFTEMYDMGLNLARVAADAFEEQTGQSMNQLTMAQLAVTIAKMLENW